MSQTSVGAQSESDSGIEEPFETDRRNAEKTQTPRDVGGNDSTERQLELREKYDFAVARGFDQVKTIAAINPSEIISESTATSDDDGVSLRSYEGSGPLAVPDQTTVPVTLIKNYITDCSEFQTGPLTNVVNNVTVVVKDEASASSQESIETGRKKLGVITTVVTGSVLLTLILVIIVVIVQIAHLRIDTTNVEPSSKQPALPYDDTYDVEDHTGPGNISWVSRAMCGLHNPPKYTTMDNMTLPTDMVVVGHTVSPECTSVESCCARVSSIQASHVKHLNDIGYHFLVGSDGNIYEGRPWYYIGAHTFGSNCKFGLAFIGNFMINTPIEKQVDAAFRLIEGLLSANLLSQNYSIVGQNDVSATESPGAKLIATMADWPHYRKEDQVVKRPCHSAKPVG